MASKRSTSWGSFTACSVHPAQVGQWKREIQEQTEKLFEKKRGLKKADGPDAPERLYSEISRLKVELDWLKNPQATRRGQSPLSTARSGEFRFQVQ